MFIESQNTNLVNVGAIQVLAKDFPFGKLPVISELPNYYQSGLDSVPNNRITATINGEPITIYETKSIGEISFCWYIINDYIRLSEMPFYQKNGYGEVSQTNILSLSYLEVALGDVAEELDNKLIGEYEGQKLKWGQVSSIAKTCHTPQLAVSESYAVVEALVANSDIYNYEFTQELFIVPKSENR